MTLADIRGKSFLVQKSSKYASWSVRASTIFTISPQSQQDQTFLPGTQKCQV